MSSINQFIITESELLRYNGFDANVVIPDSVKKIGNSAFSFKSNIVSVVIPKSVTEIKNGAFFNCPALKKLDLTESTCTISGKMFMNCSKLEEIKVSDKNKNYKSIDGVLFDKSGKKLLFCPEAKKGKYIIPKGVKEIGENAFLGCSNLTDIKIPEGVVKIGDSAFSGCKGLTVMVLPKSAKKIGEKVFWCCSSLSNVTVAKK